jgi:hypothetical protein
MCAHAPVEKTGNLSGRGHRRSARAAAATLPCAGRSCGCPVGASMRPPASASVGQFSVVRVGILR